MKKKILPILLAAATFCAAMPVFADYSFSDIEDDKYSWCAPQIEEMYNEGFINGYEDGTYRPDGQVTKLEGIAMFARVMGSKNENNDEVMALAHTQYDSAIKLSSLPWGEDEIVYMMYKGALTAADLTTYINGDAKSLPMTRGEAAVIITKAMGGEAKATDESGISLHYKDARDIPTNILQYVKFVTDEGIMNGIDDAFCADGTVTRSQIAVMLSRVAERCDYSFEKSRIVSIDEENSVITYISDGEEVEYTYTDDTDFAIKGEKAQVSSVPSSVAALVQYSGETPVLFDAMSDVADEEITAIFVGYNSSSTSMRINVKSSENASATKTYTCDIDVPITYQGSPATIKALQKGDAVVLSMSDGKVYAIDAVEKVTDIKGVTVVSVDVDNSDTTMTISSADTKYDGKTYPISDNVSVTKNGDSSDMSSIYVGDKVNIRLKYGEIISVTSTAVNNTVEGVLTNIAIGEKSEITLNVGGKSQTYQIPVNCVIEKGGETADIYSLRLNDALKVTVQSDAVVSIKSIASYTEESGKVSGVVTAVNSSFNFVSVMTETSAEPVKVNVTVKTKYTVVRGGTTNTTLNTIEVGDSVECYVTSSNGALVATDIVVEKAD